jgi:hypothetical protein
MTPDLSEVHFFAGVNAASVFPEYYEVSEAFDPLKSNAAGISLCT